MALRTKKMQRLKTEFNTEFKAMHIPVRIVVCVSGGGRSLENLVQSQNSLWKVCGVISSSEHCKANDIARDHALPLLIDSFDKSKKEETLKAINDFLESIHADVVVLAGFLKLFPTVKPHCLVVNIHPALLPKFGGRGMYGMNVHKAVFESKSSVSGATIHLVNEKFDDGRILMQEQVEISHLRTPQEIADTVFEVEKRILPRFLNELVGSQLEQNREMISSMRDEFWNRFDTFVSIYYKGEGHLQKAIRYALGGRGKGVRPVMAMLICDGYGIPVSQAFAAGVSLEMIHTYSLVHDDLPCMDDDDLRRGRPTVHKVYDEAAALLVGDSLLTDAFNVLTNDVLFPELKSLSPSSVMNLISILSRAAGSRGMIRGQDLDLVVLCKPNVLIEQLNEVHELKTGALMGAACAMGGVSANCLASDIPMLEKFGRQIGLAFQAIDDSIDGLAGTGKTAGKDENQGKITYSWFMGRENIVKFAKDLTDSALSSLPDRIKNRDLIEQFVKELVFRQK